MSTAELKSNLHKLIDTIQDSRTLSIIYSLLTNSFSATTAKLSADEKKAADKAIDSIQAGRIHQHEDVMAEMKKKYPDLYK